MKIYLIDLVVETRKQWLNDCFINGEYMDFVTNNDRDLITLINIMRMIEKYDSEEFSNKDALNN